LLWHYKTASNGWSQAGGSTLDTATMLLPYWRSGRFSGTLPVANGGTNASTFTAGSVVFAGTSGTYTQDNSNLFYDNTNDRLGIATSTPRTILDVKSVKLNAAKLATGNGVAVLENDVTNDDTPDYQAYAISNILRYRGTQGTNNSTRGIIASLNSAFNSSTGTVSEMSGFYLDLRNLSTGTVTNAYGMKIPNFENASGGTITNKYGFYSDIANSGATNKWNIYVNGAAPNYFNGNVGIGTTSPLALLNVMGTVRINSASAPDANYYLQLENSSSQKAKANAWDTYSDSRIKTNRQPIINAIDKINLLNPTYYNQHDSYVEDDLLNIDYNNSYKSLGFIAQEVYEVIPEAVNMGTTNELWAMDYTKLIPILTKAIQEQQALIKALEQRIINLENK
jgi:uncharacterized protein YqkB